jgi:hypothetical protein
VKSKLLLSVFKFTFTILNLNVSGFLLISQKKILLLFITLFGQKLKNKVTNSIFHRKQIILVLKCTFLGTKHVGKAVNFTKNNNFKIGLKEERNRQLRDDF